MTKKERLFVKLFKKYMLDENVHVTIFAVPNDQVDTFDMKFVDDSKVTFYVARQFHDFLFNDVPERNKLIISAKFYNRRGYRIVSAHAPNSSEAVANKFKELLRKVGKRDRKISLRVSNGYRSSEKKFKAAEIDAVNLNDVVNGLLKSI